MKSRLFSLFTTILAAGMLVAGCNKPGPETETPSITVNPETIDAGFEESVFEISVKSNCNWNISKTDPQGESADWVKCDVSSGNGDTSFKIKVLKNEGADRRKATVTLSHESTKAFIDISQAGNPNPDVEPDPEPEPELLELNFDFTAGGLDGWPTANDQSWAALKNCDSGCATDNGGTATDNSRRRAQVSYTIDGAAYDFTLADPNGAEKHNIRLDPAKGVYIGTYRFFGIPAIDGRKIVKIEMVQNASTQNPEKFTRNVGVAKWVYHKDVPVAEIQYVEGGEPQNQYTNGETYVYELAGTAPNTVYWINASTNASIIKSLKLCYADADGSEAPLGPEPADPGNNTDPDPGQGTDPAPEIDPNALKLSFDFSGEPFEGWPVAAKYTHVDGGIECVYPLNGVNYVFVPADCDTASAGQAFWQPPVDGKPGYFAFNAQYRYLGLPKLEGYILIKVTCHNVKLSSVTPKVGITKSIAASAAHPAEDAYVSGGKIQSWNPDGGEEYTYELGGTEANTRYYIYAYAKGAVDRIDLVYNPVKQ
ncbi:MAG: hypothetical protein IKH11_00215 [Bacteroidales bacterium]|nr:hypothetical protein [Bacteroidales bacterium]